MKEDYYSSERFDDAKKCDFDGCFVKRHTANAMYRHKLACHLEKRKYEKTGKTKAARCTVGGCKKLATLQHRRACHPETIGRYIRKKPAGGSVGSSSRG